MTTVCCNCGWLVVTGHARCSRCRGVAVSMRAARRALRVEKNIHVLNTTPEARSYALSVKWR